MKEGIVITVMGETVGGASFGGEYQEFTLDMVGLRCLFDTQVAMSSRQVDL